MCHRGDEVRGADVLLRGERAAAWLAVRGGCYGPRGVLLWAWGGWWWLWVQGCCSSCGSGVVSVAAEGCGMGASWGLWAQGQLLWCAVVTCDMGMWGHRSAATGLTVTCPTVCPR